MTVGGKEFFFPHDLLPINAIYLSLVFWVDKPDGPQMPYVALSQPMLLTLLFKQSVGYILIIVMPLLFSKTTCDKTTCAWCQNIMPYFHNC